MEAGPAGSGTEVASTDAGTDSNSVTLFHGGRIFTGEPLKQNSQVTGVSFHQLRPAGRNSLSLGRHPGLSYLQLCGRAEVFKWFFVF